MTVKETIQELLFVFVVQNSFVISARKWLNEACCMFVIVQQRENLATLPVNWDTQCAWSGSCLLCCVRIQGLPSCVLTFLNV